MRNFFNSAILSLFLTFPVFAQFGSSGAVDARSMGMAKTYNATAAGVYAIGINPSNLTNTGDDDFQISTILPLPEVSLRTGTNFISIDDINYFFGGINGKARFLNQSDKQRLNNLFNNGGFVFSNAVTNLFSFSYNAGNNIGAFAVSINDEASGKFSFPQAIIDIALSGNLRGKTYSLNDTKVSAWWIRDYTFSYAHDFSNILSSVFNKFSAGISFKMVQGFVYAGTEHINTYFSTQTNDAISGHADFRGVSSFSPDFGVKYDFDSTKSNSNPSPFPTPAGNGFGIDLGFSAIMDNVWHFSLALTDIGSINWTKHAAQFNASGSIYLNDITNQDQIDSLNNKITGKSSKLSSFTTQLPTALRIGASYFFNKQQNPIPGTLLLAVDYNQGFNDMPGNSKKPRFSLGAEWKPMDFFPFVRTGISFGGLLGFHWGVGLGIDAGLLEFNLATSDMQAFAAPNSAKYLSVSFGSRWKF